MLFGFIIGLIPFNIALGYAIYYFHSYKLSKGNQKIFWNELQKQKEIEKKLRHELCESQMETHYYHEWLFSTAWAKVPGEYWITATRLVKNAPNKDAAFRIVLNELNLPWKQTDHKWSFKIIPPPAERVF